MSAYVSDWSQEVLRRLPQLRRRRCIARDAPRRAERVAPASAHARERRAGRRRRPRGRTSRARTARSRTPRGATRRRSAGRTSRTTRWRTTSRRRRMPRARPARTSASRGRRSGPTPRRSTQFSIESGALVDRLAAAIHDSAETPERRVRRVVHERRSTADGSTRAGTTLRRGRRRRSRSPTLPSRRPPAR